jgi:hypothetical protein
MPLSVEESQLLLRLKGVILNFGDQYKCQQTSRDIVQAIEDNLNGKYDPENYGDKMRQKLKEKTKS